MNLCLCGKPSLQGSQHCGDRPCMFRALQIESAKASLVTAMQALDSLSSGAVAGVPVGEQPAVRAAAAASRTAMDDFMDLGRDLRARVAGTCRIYVASSWRNEERQQQAVRSLRDQGHDVYDFRNPAPGDHGFGWRQCATEAQLRDPKAFRHQVLSHPIARAAFAKDMGALVHSDITVLVLPCGRSAHLELGIATGMRQRTVVWLDDPISEPELMYLACTSICTSLGEVLSECAPR